MRMFMAALLAGSAVGLAACGSTHKTVVVTPPDSTVVVPSTDDSHTTVVTPKEKTVIVAPRDGY